MQPLTVTEVRDILNTAIKGGEGDNIAVIARASETGDDTIITTVLSNVTLNVFYGVPSVVFETFDPEKFPWSVTPPLEKRYK